MNAITTKEIAILSLPERAAVALGESANVAKLHDLVKLSSAILLVNSKPGRDEAHRAGMVLAKTRTTITATGKAARADATAFSKAVIAMEADLIAIIEPEESRVLALRDGWDAAEQAAKDAKIVAEMVRVAGIRRIISVIQAQPMAVIGMTAAKISAAIADLVAAEVGPEFQEFQAEAAAAKSDALEVMAKAESTQRAIEVEAESRRQEAARMNAQHEEEATTAAAKLAADREELRLLQVAQAQQAAQFAEQQRLAKVEADRVAADQEAMRQVNIAEAKRLAEQQSEADARDAEAERQAQVDAAHGEGLAINAKVDVSLAEIDAACIEFDHAEALELNAAWDTTTALMSDLYAVNHEPRMAAQAESTPLATLADSAGDEPETDAEIIIGLAGSLEKVLSWIANWEPEFCNDPDWPADRDRAQAAIKRAEGRAA